LLALAFQIYRPEAPLRRELTLPGVALRSQTNDENRRHRRFTWTVGRLIGHLEPVGQGRLGTE